MVQIRLVAPAFDLDLEQLAGARQLRHSLPSLTRRHPIVVSEVARGGDAVRPRGEAHELALRFLARQRLRVVRVRYDTLGQVVRSREPGRAALGDRDRAAGEMAFQRDLRL